jgi:hypothetical protein
VRRGTENSGARLASGETAVILLEVVVPAGQVPATIMAVDSQLMLPERFAVDWMGADEQGHLYHSDPNRAEDYLGYGADLLAVADGTVIEAVDRYLDSPLPYDATSASQTVDSLAAIASSSTLVTRTSCCTRISNRAV